MAYQPFTTPHQGPEVDYLSQREYERGPFLGIMQQVSLNAPRLGKKEGGVVGLVVSGCGHEQEDFINSGTSGRPCSIKRKTKRNKVSAILNTHAKAGCPQGA